MIVQNLLLIFSILGCIYLVIINQQLKSSLTQAQEHAQFASQSHYKYMIDHHAKCQNTHQGRINELQGIVKQVRADNEYLQMVMTNLQYRCMGLQKQVFTLQGINQQYGNQMDEYQKKLVQYSKLLYKYYQRIPTISDIMDAEYDIAHNDDDNFIIVRICAWVRGWVGEIMDQL